MKPFFLRVPPGDLDRMDLLARAMAKHPAFSGMVKVPKAVVLRQALQVGLSLMEEEYEEQLKALRKGKG